MLSSRERLLRCFRHQPIDRVPISTYDLNGWDSGSWQMKDESYENLMRYVRKYTDCIFMKSPKLVCKDNSALETTHWNEEGSHYTRKIFRTPKGELTALSRTDEGIHTTWTLKHLLEDIDDIDKYLAIPYEAPTVDMADFYRQQEELGDRGVMMMDVEDPICTVAELFEMGTFLVHAITEKGKIKYFMDAIFERQMQILRQILKYDVRDVMFRIIGPEYATPPYLPPELFNCFVTCYLEKICKEIKEAGGIPRIHSHGKIRKVLEEFRLSGAEAIDPIEPVPDGDIDLAEVKQRYGSDFCLFGNIELKELETAEKSRIDRLVQKSMSEAKGESGFVLLPTATPLNTPLSKKTEENFIQMIESGLIYGKY